MVFNIESIGLFISIIWLLIVSIFLWQLFSHYNSLVKGATSKSLKSVLDELLELTQKNKKDIDLLKNRCDTIEQEGRFHIQKIGLLRFNPFKDTGGDQSFILGLLDGNDTGTIISGLYSRSGMRWYAKQVKNAKGVDHELSDEERKAIKDAKSTQ